MKPVVARLTPALLLAAACRGSPTGGENPPCPASASPLASAQAASPSRSSPFDSVFAAAGREFGVPPELLKAIAWVETRWQMVEGREEFAGQPVAFGVMALRGQALERSAALAGVTAEQARRDAVANIRAAAALLNSYAAGGTPWSDVVARYSGIDAAAGRAAYVAAVDRAGLAPRAAPPAGAAPCPPPAPDYGAAVWRPSPNFDQRATDSTGAIHMAIIHTCESNYASCWSWLTNSVSQVSAHYVVSEDGSEISQLVLERDRAWHIAALYDCTLNRRHHCTLNDVQSNHFTVGIEHAGFVSQDSFPASQLAASAALLCDITRDRGIPRDWQHIVGHGQLQPANRTDPGPNWPWIPYLHRVQAACGEVVVDDATAYNDPTVATVAVPAGWMASDTTPDYYGGGYRWASTALGATDGVEFSFRLAAAGARTLDARWTNGANRSPHATYVVIAATGDTLATVTMNQTAGGGAWHTLGTWTFPVGWSRVVLQRRDTSGFVVVADAVRVR